MNDKCLSIWGHKFEARYNTIPSSSIENIEGTTRQIEVFLDGLSKKEYIYDVCVRCGMTTKEEINEPS